MEETTWRMIVFQFRESYTGILFKRSACCTQRRWAALHVGLGFLVLIWISVLKV